MVESLEKSFSVDNPRRPRLRWLKRIGKGLLILAIIAALRLAWRHHQITKALDEAVAEMDRVEPGWRLADIEAAREQIPEEENSARVVVAAAKLLPQGWPKQDFSDLFEHLAPEEQLSIDEVAFLTQELDNVRPALKEAYKLAARPPSSRTTTNRLRRSANRSKGSWPSGATIDLGCLAPRAKRRSEKRADRLPCFAQCRAFPGR